MASEAGTLLGYCTLGGLILLLVPLLFRMLLCCFGFTCWGVRRESYASDWHSLIGNVEAGSRFSRYQSCGAGGTPCGIYAGLFLFGAYLAMVLFIMDQLGHANLEPITNSTVYPIDFTTAGYKSTDFSTMEFNSTDFSATESNSTDFVTMLRFLRDSTTMGSKAIDFTTKEPAYKLNDLLDQLHK